MLEVDIDRMRVTWRGRPVEGLTHTEILIVAFLAARAGVYRTRDQIIEHCHPKPDEALDRQIDAFIKRIRRKFEAADPDFNSIRTAYRVGYKWDDALSLSGDDRGHIRRRFHDP